MDVHAIFSTIQACRFVKHRSDILHYFGVFDKMSFLPLFARIFHLCYSRHFFKLDNHFSSSLNALVIKFPFWMTCLLIEGDYVKCIAIATD